MAGSNNNNNSNSVVPRILQGGMDGTRKFGHTRRALSVINQDLHSRPYPVVNKRPLSEKHQICEKKQVDPVHRPITRRFAAQMAIMQQSCVQGSNKSSSSIPNSNNVFGDAIAIDEENKSPVPVDQPVPMSLEQPEEPMQMMEEVEMEDIIEEPILNIDSCDVKNQLAVVEYIEDIHVFYKKIEGVGCVSPNYMAQQVDINERMRAILIDWLIEVHDKFDLMQETLFLTINLIDRFLAKQTVMRKKLQLVGLVAMLLACKYEEVSVPVVSDLIIISDRAYSRKDVLDMEKLMLNTLQFNMSVPTVYVFMKRFLKAAQTDKKLEILAFYFVELSLVEYKMVQFPPSMLAASAVYTAQCTLNGFKHWSKTCEWHTNYSEDQLLACSSMMVGLQMKAGTGKLKGVYKKYNSPKFSFAARCEPASFLLENQVLQLQGHV